MRALKQRLKSLDIENGQVQFAQCPVYYFEDGDDGTKMVVHKWTNAKVIHLISNTGTPCFALSVTHPMSLDCQ
eukprot:3076778-Lingulodinium_polyedra.AAC.1